MRGDDPSRRSCGDQLRLLATKIVAPHLDPVLFQRYEDRARSRITTSLLLRRGAARARVRRALATAATRAGSRSRRPRSSADRRRQISRRSSTAAGEGAGRGDRRRRRRSRDGGGGDAEDGRGAAARGPTCRRPPARSAVQPPRPTAEPIRLHPPGRSDPGLCGDRLVDDRRHRAPARAAGAEPSPPTSPRRGCSSGSATARGRAIRPQRPSNPRGLSRPGASSIAGVGDAARARRPVLPDRRARSSPTSRRRRSTADEIAARDQPGA